MRYLSELLRRLPFVVVRRSRWERIRVALDAWPRLVDHLQALVQEETDRADRAELEARQTRTDAKLLSVRGANGERLIQSICRY